MYLWLRPIGLAFAPLMYLWLRPIGLAFAAPYANLRGSATRPSTALAAAVNGDASNVRAPLPCRPSKFRLLVLTDVWPAGTESPFMAMHMLHPASRHSAPASLKMRSRPSASAKMPAPNGAKP